MNCHQVQVNLTTFSHWGIKCMLHVKTFTLKNPHSCGSHIFKELIGLSPSSGESDHLQSLGYKVPAACKDVYLKNSSLLWQSHI